MRLDRFVGRWAGAGKRRTRGIFEEGRVLFNGMMTDDGSVALGKFDRVEVDGEILQAMAPRYVMLHKPCGVVSATIDDGHETVIDLIGEEWAKELHLAGRLDRYTSGLMILTNDSRYSESLTDPFGKVGKRYFVEVDGVISPKVIAAFEEGLWFAKEKITTSPAEIELQDKDSCRLTIFEGKHHQIKRMFARFDLKVVKLHREAIGALDLPASLKERQWKEFLPDSGFESMI